MHTAKMCKALRNTCLAGKTGVWQKFFAGLRSVTMKLLILTAVIQSVLLMPVPLSAAPPAERDAGVAASGLRLVVARERSSQMQGDLAGDGRMFTVAWSVSAVTEEGDFYRLTVADDEGRIIWASPATKRSGHPLAFGSWHHGVSLPEALGDMDGDGMQELIVPAAQSDVSPVRFRIFRWTGKGFEPGPVTCLAGRGGRADFLSWQDEPALTDFWVQHWKKAGRNNTAVVELVRYPGGAEVESATAIVARAGHGFRLVQWLKAPRKPVADPPAKGDTVYLFPDSSRRVLSDAELASLTPDELWTARNEIYARRGLMFTTAKGRALAARLQRAGLYTPLSASQDTVAATFNKVEAANVERIRRYEER